MTQKTIRGVPDPRWWQIHPTMGFCSAWLLLLTGAASACLLT